MMYWIYPIISAAVSIFLKIHIYVYKKNLQMNKNRQHFAGTVYFEIKPPLVKIQEGVYKNRTSIERNIFRI